MKSFFWRLIFFIWLRVNYGCMRMQFVSGLNKWLIRRFLLWIKETKMVGWVMLIVIDKRDDGERWWKVMMDWMDVPSSINYSNSSALFIGDFFGYFDCMQKGLPVLVRLISILIYLFLWLKKQSMWRHNDSSLAIRILFFNERSIPFN